VRGDGRERRGAEVLPGGGAAGAGPGWAMPEGDAGQWLGVGPAPLPVAGALAWVPTARCGAVVQFLGTVRDHAEGRPGVESLTYEAYEEECGPRLERLVADLRHRWPGVGRVVALHAVGTLGVGEVAVVVAAAAPHRQEAFEAALHLIDAVKATLPVWKRERWAGGEGWSPSATEVAEVAEVGAAAGGEGRP